jgi:hypothetical protein
VNYLEMFGGDLPHTVKGNSIHYIKRCLFFACGTYFDKFVFIYVSDKNIPTDFECLLRFSFFLQQKTTEHLKTITEQ